MFTLPIKLVSLVNVREHWRVRSLRAKSQRGMAYLVCPKVQLPCIVTITRIAPRPLDSDNNVISAKHARDGIADRLGVNDNDPRIEWRYKQGKGKPRVYEVFVTIEAMA